MIKKKWILPDDMMPELRPCMHDSFHTKLELSRSPRFCSTAVRSGIARFKVGKLMIEGRQEKRLLMVGLDAGGTFGRFSSMLGLLLMVSSGKTTMMDWLDARLDMTIPPIGFLVETGHIGKITMQCWYVSGLTLLWSPLPLTATSQGLRRFGQDTSALAPLLHRT